MIDRYKLYLPKSKREVTIEVSGPRNEKNILFDTFYLLDGQNAFRDSEAAFGRSLRATKYLNYIARECKHRILGVAVYNSGSDLGRVNEYSPFKIDNVMIDSWKKNNPKICERYCDDFINTIIPFIEGKYNVVKDSSHRFIYGSSLAATTILYMGFKYEEAFGYLGAFSTATFLFHKEFMKFLKEYNDPKKNVFLYYGKKEISDSEKSKGLYAKEAKELYNFFKKQGNNIRVVVSASSIHNEECWENALLDFLSFCYSNDIIYRL